MRHPIELRAIDLEHGWTPLPGFAGLHVQVLADDLDEKAGTGGRSRLVRFEPGARTYDLLQHHYWEEVYVLAGDLQALDVDRPSLAFSIRPPGTPHGPFTSRSGCLLLEIQYFAAVPHSFQPLSHFPK
jgi:hypothetical protein